MSSNKEKQQFDVTILSKDLDLIRQVEHSLKDRQNGRIYDQEKGLEYLRTNCCSNEQLVSKKVTT